MTIRLAGPVASFSAPRIDGKSDTLSIPTRSMLTGLIGAALGLGYDQHDRLQQIQDAMRIALVVHRPGVVVRDYQTIRMGLPHMRGPMWWNDGEKLGVMERKGGDPERMITAERPLLFDFDATIVIELMEGFPYDAKAVLEALRQPKFPLGLGQRSCLPSDPIDGQIIEDSTINSLSEVVTSVSGSGTIYLPAELAAEDDRSTGYVSVPAGRNWRTRQHGGIDTYAVHIKHGKAEDGEEHRYS